MITYIKGDLFKSVAPILGHANNCYGSWGAGVAVVFRRKFPKSYKVYQEHCKQHSASDLIGTTLLIEPENGQSIACLFTSDRTGAYKLPPDQIVHYTDLAMRDLVRQLQESSSDQKVTMSLPKINAGLFAVPWEQTEEVLKKYTDDLNIEVFEL